MAKLRDIWKLAAPEIDIYAPDIYVPYFSKVCDEYHTDSNPLFIAECATHSYAGAREIYAIGRHHAMCYAPFGIEDLGEPFTTMQGRLFGMDTDDEMLKTPQCTEEYAKINAFLQGMMPVFVGAYGTKRLQGTSVEEGETQKLDFGKYVVSVDFDSSYVRKKNGTCMVVQDGEDVFYILASGCVLDFLSNDEASPNVDFIKVEEGSFKEGVFVPGRRLNGDEASVMIMEEVNLIRVELFRYGNE